MSMSLSILDETIPENALDTRTRGIGRNKQGSVIWSIPKDLPFRSGMFQNTLRPNLNDTYQMIIPTDSHPMHRRPTYVYTCNFLHVSILIFVKLQN